MPNVKLPLEGGGEESVDLPYTDEGIETAETIEELAPDADVSYYAPGGVVNAQNRKVVKPFQYGGDVTMGENAMDITQSVGMAPGISDDVLDRDINPDEEEIT